MARAVQEAGPPAARAAPAAAQRAEGRKAQLLSDARLRELERRWHETGDAEDGRAYVRALARIEQIEPGAKEIEELCARWLASGEPGDGRAYLEALAARQAPKEARFLGLRAGIGDLAPELLELAALLGYPPAVMALPSTGRETYSTKDVARVLGRPDSVVRRWRRQGCPVGSEGRNLMWDLRLVLDWALGHEIFQNREVGPLFVRVCWKLDGQAGFRASIALVRFALPGLPRAREVFAATEEWLSCPCKRHARVVAKCRGQVRSGHQLVRYLSDAVRHFQLALTNVGRWISFAGERDLRNASELGNDAFLRRDPVSSPRTLAELQAPIRHEVVPWALGLDSV